MAHIFRYLDSVGDGSGTKDTAVNGASTAQTFKYTPETRDRTLLFRMMVQITDAGALSANDYGNISNGLTNGVLVQIRKQADDAVSVDLLDGLPVKINADWSRVCYDMGPDDFGAGNNHIKARWTFSKSGLPLYLSDDEYFCVVVQDDLSGLVSQFFMLQGQVGRF